MSDIVKDMIDYIEEKEREVQVIAQENSSKVKNDVVNGILNKLDEEFEYED